MTEVPLMNHELPFNFPSNMCLSQQSWDILEGIKREYDRKLEKSVDENEVLRREVRYYSLFFYLFNIDNFSKRRLENDKNKLEAEKEDLVNDVLIFFGFFIKKMGRCKI